MFLDYKYIIVALLEQSVVINTVDGAHAELSDMHTRGRGLIWQRTTR